MNAFERWSGSANQHPANHRIGILQFRTIVETRWTFVASLIVIGCVVLVTYHPALGSGFWGSDYIFLERAGRLDILEYLSTPFDVRFLDTDYVSRPLFGLVLWVGYSLFRSDATGYHAIGLLVHLANCFMLLVLVVRVTAKYRLGLLASLMYATLPIYSLAILWISDVSEPLAAFFYIGTVFFWLSFLQHGQFRFYIIAFFMYLLALAAKETAVTSIAILFLLDRLVVRYPARIRDLVWRYVPLVLVLLIFLLYSPLQSQQFSIQRVMGAAETLVHYLPFLMFPWTVEGWTSDGHWGPWVEILLVTAYIVLVVIKRERRMGFLGLAFVIVIVPFLVLSFEKRFLYLPAIISAIFLALALEWANSGLKWKWAQRIMPALVLAVVVVFNGQSVSDASNAFQAFARLDRVPFREIAQKHPTFDKGTYLYLIDPPTPTPFLTGMFFLRYASTVTVGSTEFGPARWREYPTALMYYFDESRHAKEVLVDQTRDWTLSPALPIAFQAPIRLEECEIAQNSIRRKEDLVLLLSWGALEKMERDYTVFVHLLNKDGQLIAAEDAQPQNGRAPTHTWRTGAVILDPHVIPIPADAPIGNDYRLEIGLYYLPTMERVGMVDAAGRITGDTLTIEPFHVLE